MDFIMSSIISGIIYDVISKGVKVTFANVFGNFNSSVGIEDVRDLLSEINSNVKNIQSEKDVEKIVESKFEYMDVIAQMSYNTEFAKRLDYVMCIMNVAIDKENKLNIDSLSKWLGFNSSNEIKKYYTGTEEPEFEFERMIADKIGVNVEWLQTGNGSPFKSILPSENRAYHILKQSNLDNIKEFLFLSNKRRELIIVEKIDKYKYVYIPHRFVFNSCVGGDGSSELYSLYFVIKELKKLGCRVNASTYEISDDEYEEVFHGEHYPLEYIRKGKYVQFIIDDFIDLYNNDEQKERYISYYGKDFVVVQDIVRSFIK